MTKAGRPRNKPSIDKEIARLVARATEEEQFILAQRLIEILKERHIPEPQKQEGE